MNLDLFETDGAQDGIERLADGAFVLRNPFGGRIGGLLESIDNVLRLAPLRNMLTPGGKTVAAQMSNCGELGWISDRRGYRYVACDPQTGKPWPSMPTTIRALATEMAAAVGFVDFLPDACLINRYAAGIGMGLHQDRDEQNFAAPILSVSLGLPAVFLFGGEERRDKTQAIPLEHGDVVIWGGPARMRFHGIRPIKPGKHPLTGACRLNLTLRTAGPDRVRT